MNPAIFHLLIRLFIGLPGVLIWVGGLFFGGGFVVSILGPGQFRIHIEELALLGALAIATLVGFAMMISTVIVTSGKRYRMKARRLLPCAGLEFSAQVLAVGSLATLISGYMQAMDGEPSLAFLYEIAGMLMLAGAFVVADRANAMRKLWKAEYRMARNDSPWD